MALLNWIFWKKALFTTGIIGASLSPIAIVNRGDSSYDTATASKYKKNLEYLTGKYAKQFGIDEFAKKVFGMHQMKTEIDSVFAEDLAHEAVKSSVLFKEKYKKIVEEEQKSYDEEFRNSGNKYKFYDSLGGNRDDMKRRKLTEKNYEDFKTEILDFNQYNFTLNRYSDTQHYIKHSAHLSEEILKNQDNWKHIGFFSREDPKDQHDPVFAKHKYKFINFAHKQWFQEVKPFYAWMSLWKYKDNAQKHELEILWDLNKASGKKANIDKASYNFPYFENRTTQGLSTTDKFKNFFNNVVSSYSKGSTIYIPKDYTEDSSTTILVEGSSMYSKLYVRFAAAASYKYQKRLLKNGSSNSANINERAKNENVNSYKQPTELFMFKSNEGGNTKAKVKIEKELLKTNFQTKNEIADLVEIKDTPWVFIRNRAGIHAIAVDAENLEEGKTDFYGHFNFRTLQVLYKERLRLTQTLDIKVEDVIKTFKEYLTHNFNRLMLKFLYEGDNKFFESEVPSIIVKFKESFLKREKLEDIRRKYISRIKLRESIIDTYVQTSWEVGNDNKFKSASPEKGMVGMIPWKLKDDETTNGNDFHLFEEIEKIYDYDFLKKSENGNSQTTTKTLTKEFQEKEKKYIEEKDKFIGNLKLEVDPTASNINSDRVFSNNYYINRINDKLLEKSDTFNELLFNYLLKKDYLGKSFIGNNGFIKKDSDWSITVPNNYQASSGGEQNGDSTVIDEIGGSTDTEKAKKVLGKLDKQITMSYYSRLLLEKESSNPWDAAKYGGVILKNEKDKTRDNLHKVALKAYEDRFTFGVENFKNKHYRFLTTLSYLTAENFENLLKHLSSTLSYEKDAYIVFSSTKLNKNKVKLNEDSLNNPFLNRSSIDSTTYKKDVTDIFQYFSSVNFSDEGKKISDDFKYGGFYTGTNASALQIPSEYRRDFISNTLYRYGKDAEEMNKYILSITSESDFKKVVKRIQEAVKNQENSDSNGSADNGWVANLNRDTIYISTDSSGSSDNSNKTLKTLTLQEKKNLLSAYLNNVKVDITDEVITKENYKKIFLTDPDKSYNETGSPHTKKTSNNNGAYEEKVKAALFSKQGDIKFKESDNKEKEAFKLFHINTSNVKDFESFKTWANSNLSSDCFWTWIIDLAMDYQVQELAITDLGSKVEKVQAYDAKWIESARDKFVDQ